MTLMATITQIRKEIANEREFGFNHMVIPMWQLHMLLDALVKHAPGETGWDELAHAKASLQSYGYTSGDLGKWMRDRIDALEAQIKADAT